MKDIVNITERGSVVLQILDDRHTIKFNRCIDHEMPLHLVSPGACKKFVYF